jgi:hypothetical protein
MSEIDQLKVEKNGQTGNAILFTCFQCCCFEKVIEMEKPKEEKRRITRSIALFPEKMWVREKTRAEIEADRRWEAAHPRPPITGPVYVEDLLTGRKTLVRVPGSEKAKKPAF